MDSMKEKIKQLNYRHVDVFSKTPLTGNGLAVFTNCEGISIEAMQKITQEMKQFESIFLFPIKESNRFNARIFTVDEELDFAGHPILGAACVLHEQKKNGNLKEEWIFELPAKTVLTTTVKKEKSYLVAMEQVFVKVSGTPALMTSIEVSGDVCMVAKGTFDDFEV